MIWLVLSAAAAPLKCDGAALGRARDVLGEIDREHQIPLAAAALGEACRFPAPFAEALQQVANSFPSEHGSILDAKLAIAAVDRLELACPGGVRLLADSAASTRADGRASLYAGCRPSFATEAEWTAASGMMAAPILLGPWLAEAGADPSTVRALVRSLAGISDRPVDNPVRTFRPLVP